MLGHWIFESDLFNCDVWFKNDISSMSDGFGSTSVVFFFYQYVECLSLSYSKPKGSCLIIVFGVVSDLHRSFATAIEGKSGFRGLWLLPRKILNLYCLRWNRIIKVKPANIHKTRNILKRWIFRWASGDRSSFTIFSTRGERVRGHKAFAVSFIHKSFKMATVAYSTHSVT